MNKARKIVLGIFACIPITLVVYIAFVIHFTNVFMCGTYINGIYCTGFSVKECNDLLMADYQQDYIELQDKSNVRYRITYEQIDGSVDFTEALSGIMNEQNEFYWFTQLVEPKSYTLKPKIVYNDLMLGKVLSESAIFDVQQNKELDVFILEGENGYILQDNRKGYLNPEKVHEAARYAMESQTELIDLVLLGCYEDLAYTDKMQETLALWEKVEAFQNSCKVVYDMGDKVIPVDASVVCHFIKLNEDNTFMLDKDGELVFDKDGVTEFINGLASEYDTYGTKRKFTTTSGEIKEISGGTYGSKLNQKAEVKYLTNAFLEGIEENHIPAYTRSSTIRGKDDIGNTYIEVDMTNQKMYYYKNGVLKLETDVVTGNLKKNHDTPEGINYVYAKQKNRILRGPGYASPVDYWMPVNGGIGIHDASWRSEFGGEIYKTDGSHGCINTPLEKVKELYDMVTIGTPVVMYY
ncbi:MAG: L,D-transpeptidase family protein [Lachnospiraceae bacterium]|nr:L,D-transpeptidase family protein [Lachnospiraceae bacterium]